MRTLNATTLGLCLLFGIAGTAEAQNAPQAKDPKQDTPSDDTVVVTGKTPAVKRSAEGTVYDVSKSAQAQSGTAADVLNTVPAVHVSPDGNVTLRGDGNVQVYINGRPAAEMKGDSRAVTLQSMSGGDIANVEVITNPSAKYDANGGGIINIVLKKNRKPGAKGVLTSNLGNDRRGNIALSGTYSRARLSLHGRLGFRHDVARMRRSADIAWNDPGTGASGRNSQTLAVDALRISHAANAGLDYDLGPDDRVNLEATYGRRRSANQNDEFHQDFDGSGALTGLYYRRSVGPRGQDDTGVTLTFNHIGQSGDALKLSAAGSRSDSFQDKSYRNIYAVPAISDTAERILITTRRRLSDVSGDYVRPIGEAAQLSLGFDLQDEENHFYNAYAAIDPLTLQETPDALRSNAFVSRQTLKAAYATYQTPFAGWTLLGGLRLEQIVRNGPSAHRYTHLNPSLHATFQADNKRQWTVSLSESLQRPAPRDLNPFVIYVDAQNVTSGNPDLKPQHVSSAEASYSYTDDPFSRVVTVYYRSSSRTVTDYSYFIGDQVLLTTKRNAGSGLSSGIDTTTSGQLAKGLSYSLDANLFYAELQTADISGVFKASGLSWTAQASLEYAPGGRDSFELSGNAQGKSLTSQGTRSGTSAVNLSWRHALTPKLRLVLSANDIFNGGRQTLRTRTATIHQVAQSHDLGPVVFLGLSWTLEN